MVFWLLYYTVHESRLVVLSYCPSPELIGNPQKRTSCPEWVGQALDLPRYAGEYLQSVLSWGREKQEAGGEE